MILINILAAWLVADFISGLVHWFEDRYLDETTSIGRDNTLHHNDPRAMTRIPYWQNVDSSLAYGIPLAIVLWIAGAHQIFILSMFFACFANLVHRFAHEKKSATPEIVKLLQSTGLMISPRAHAPHHSERGILIPKSQAKDKYCAMTSWMNPLLDKIGLWHKLELCLGFCGVKTVSNETHNPNHRRH